MPPARVVRAALARFTNSSKGLDIDWHGDATGAREPCRTRRAPREQRHRVDRSDPDRHTVRCEIRSAKPTTANAERSPVAAGGTLTVLIWRHLFHMAMRGT